MNGSPTSLIAAIILALASLPSLAATRYAGGCGAPSSASISAAIAAAAAGDTILVCSGTWNEAVTVNKNDLTIRSATGNRADVTVSNSNTVFTIAASATVLKDMTITSSGGRGIHRQWTASPSAHTFENLAVTAKNDGVYVEVSGKLTFTNVTVASSDENGIELGWDTVAEHVFDTVTVTAKKSGIYIGSYGGGTYSDVEISTVEDYAIYMAPNYDTTFTNVVASSDEGDGIYLAWSPNDRNFTFTDVTVTADDKGIHVERSAKVAMTDVNATSSKSAAIYLSSSTSGQHTFSNIAATGKTYGLYTYNGGTTFSDITATATNGDAIYLRPSSAMTFTDVTASATGGYGIYLGWASAAYALNLSGLNVTATDRGLYIERSAAVTLQNSSIYSSGSDAVYLGYSASGAHVLNNLALDGGSSGSGILFESAVSSSTIGNICVSSGQYGVRITQYDARNVAISGSKFSTTSYGVSTSANPSYKTVVSGSCFMKSSTPRAYSNSTTHTFNGNFWQGIAGGTSYTDGNVRDNGTLASCPVTSCYAATVTPPVADYRFDECTWTSGTAGAVADSSGNGYSGTPYSVTTASNGVVQRGADLSANSASDYIQWPNGLLNGRTNFTVTLWFKTSVSKAQQEILHGLGSSTSDDEIEIYLVNSNKIRVNIRDKGNDYTASASFTDGAWHHLAVSRFGKKVCVYLDGTSLGCNNRSSNALSITNTNALVTGQKQTSYGGGFASAQGFQGQIEEFKVFANSLSSGQIGNLRANEAAGKNWDGTTRGTTCSSGPDHIRVFLNNSTAAITCAPRSVSAIACADAACATRHNSAVDVTLSPGGTSATIPVNGTGSPTISRTSTGTASITLSSSSPATSGSPGFRCYNGTVGTPGTEITGACNVTFADSGLFVSVPNHVSCDTSTLTITAAKADDQATKCVPAFDSGASRDIKLRFAYANPASGTQVPTVGAASPPTTALATGSDQTVAMAFTGGVATTNFRYPDAGSLMVSASYTGSVATSDSGLSMATVSNPAFVVAPASFAISGIPAAPLTAGDPFNVTLTAKNSCGETTANFGKESPTAATATITSSNPQPAAGNGTAVNATVSGFDAGAASKNIAWAEVGTIDLTATTSSYLGSTLNVSGSAAGVGRFRPAYFDTEVTHGCVAGSFTYSAQPFSVKVTAKEKNGGVTKNYGGTAWAYGTTLSNAGTATNFSGNTIANTAFSDGIGTAAGVTYTLASPPSGGASTLTLRAVDSDGVSSSGHTEGTTVLRFGRLWLGNAFGSDQRSLTIPYELQFWNGNAFVKNTGDTCTTIARANIGLFNYLGGVSEANVTVANNLPATIANSNGGGTITLTPPTTGGNLANVAGSVDLVVNLGATTTPAIATTWTDLAATNRDPDAGPTGAERPWLRSRWYGANWDRDPTARATFGVFGSSQRRGPLYIRESY